jgi:hypothetical protein
MLDDGSIGQMPSIERGGPVNVARLVCFNGCAGMRLGPEGCRNDQRVNSLVLPPDLLIAATVQFAMV